MRYKGPRPTEILPGREDAVLRSWLETAQLKRLFRQGWLKRGISESACESVADHSFGLSTLVLFLALEDGTLDVAKAVLMALVHELGEVWAGDITPDEGVSKEEKHQRELASLDKVIHGLGGADYIRELWNEFEEGVSKEALLVKQADRLEMGFQAALYQAEGSDRMPEFFQSAQKALRDSRLKDLLQEARR